MQLSAALIIAIVVRLIHVGSSLQPKQSETIINTPLVMSASIANQTYIGDKPIPGDCGRGFDCGYEVQSHNEPAISVPCPNGAKWVAKNTILLRGRGGTNALYCFANKVGSSYLFNVMDMLGMPYLDGERDLGYLSVADMGFDGILPRAGSPGFCLQDPNGHLCQKEINAICNADASLMIVRNPWDRIVSAYVDKVLTKEVFSEPPSFDTFMRTLVDKDPITVNEHFRPLAETCHTVETKESKQALYTKILRLEDEDKMREGLIDLFAKKLKFPEDQVVRALDTDRHTTEQVQENKIDPYTGKAMSSDSTDKSIGSGLDRTTFYFQQTDPELVRKYFKDDVGFGNYSWSG